MSEDVQCFSVWVCCLVLGVGFFVAIRSHAFSMRWTIYKPRRAEFPVLFRDWHTAPFIAGLEWPEKETC